jgi:hypothetical protein
MTVLVAVKPFVIQFSALVDLVTSRSRNSSLTSLDFFQNKEGDLDILALINTSQRL